MKYRAKSVEVSAVQWTGTSESWAEVCALVGDEDVIFRNPDDMLALEVNGGQVRVRVGNWIVKSEVALGTFDDEVFTATYEPVLEMGKEATDAAD